VASGELLFAAVPAGRSAGRQRKEIRMKKKGKKEEKTPKKGK
jgi:hypothetical protein